MEHYYTVKSHGVGSSCKGNEYHHVVHHLVDGRITLCGSVALGENWWIEKTVSKRDFQKVESRKGKPNPGDQVVCKLCCKILENLEKT